MCRYLTCTLAPQVGGSHVGQAICERTKGSLTLCLVAARSPGWFVGDPTSLATDNMYLVITVLAVLHAILWLSYITQTQSQCS